jgi:serine/threonine-protein kinase HipA
VTAPVDVLHVLIGGEQVGTLSRRGQRVVLTYGDAYRQRADATPLSVSLPLTAAEHSGRVLNSFLDGLLPDDERVRVRWGRQFETRTQPFDLLTHVGEDCAGAVQFVREDHLELLDPGGVQWLDDDTVAEWIATLRVDPVAWLSEARISEAQWGQFSLAGAQSKFALITDGRRWGRPYGAVPTTHIVKPASARFADYEINEHLSLALARGLGLRAARSAVVRFGDERAVVVERYDRYYDGSSWHRIHQEDLCQALGVPPSRKYENLRGPGAVEIARLLRSTSATGDTAEESVARFADALAFNWLIVGTDAHAKNYSLLLDGHDVRLAPLYDLASALPYVATTPNRRPSELSAVKLKLAMRVNATYLVREVRARDWIAMAAALDLGDHFLERIRELADEVPDVLDQILDDADLAALASPFPERFAKKLRTHVKQCLHVLDGRPPLGWRT